MEAAGIKPAEDSRRASVRADERDAPADPGPRCVAGEHLLGVDLVGRGDHEGVGEAQAPRSTAETGGCPRHSFGDRLDADIEVREKRLDLRDCFRSPAVRADEDLGKTDAGITNSSCR